MCLKCDLHERFLSPSLLPGTADGTLRTDDPKGDISTLYQMASLSPDSPYKLQVIKYALKRPHRSTLFFLIPWLGSAEIRGLSWQSGSYKHVTKQKKKPVRLGSQQVEARGADVELLPQKACGYRQELKTWALCAEKSKIDAKAFSHPVDLPKAMGLVWE